MFRGSFGGKPILSSSHEAVNLAVLKKPIPPNFDRANTFTNVLGETARGWILMLRSDLDALEESGDLNDFQELIFEFEQPDGQVQQLKLYDILIAQEPICLTPDHKADDPDAAYLVEVADRSHLVNSRNFAIAAWNDFNATNTWSQAISGLWALIGTHLGQSVVPTLPITPPGTPLNIDYEGESAWVELRRVLAFLGLGLQYRPLLPRGNQYAIIQIGAADDATDDDVQAIEDAGYKIHDGEFVDVALGRMPAGARVYFPQHPERFARDPVFVDVPNPNAGDGTQANLYVPVFDNTFAIHAADGTVQNQTALNTQAESRATDYFRMLQEGGRRKWKRFSGLWSLFPGANIKTVSWVNQPAGVYTDIYRNPYLLPDAVGFVRKPMPVRQGYAPVRLWAASLPAYTRSGNTITFTANGPMTVDGSQTAVGDRIGVNLGSACIGHVDNGIYEVQAVGNASGSQEVWRRTLDADNSDDFRSGFTVDVAGGTGNKGTRWRVWTDDPITLNTTAIWFACVKFPAKITRRHANTCGHGSGGSGSGAFGDTHHTIYSYDFVRGRWIIDLDGCFVFDVDATLGTGTAYEKGNRKVREGSIADIEAVPIDNTSGSGSGSGSSECGYVFDGSGMEDISISEAPESSVTFRYFCINGQFDEYKHDGGGNYTFVRHTGVLCGCCGSGSGHDGPGSGTGSSANHCCDMSAFAHLCLQLTSTCCWGSCRITLVPQTGSNWWTVVASPENCCKIALGGLLVHHNPDGTCDYELVLNKLDIYIGCPPGTRCAVRMSGFATSVTCSPFSLVFSNLTATQWVGPSCTQPTVSACSGSATISSGECAPEDCNGSGGGGGAGPCHWICTGSIYGWDNAYGTEPACCVGYAPTDPCTNGQTTSNAGGCGAGGGNWWCCEVQRYHTANCSGAYGIDPPGCFQVPSFANVGDTLCEAVGGGGSRLLTALAGPFSSQAECSVGCF